MRVYALARLIVWVPSRRSKRMDKHNSLSEDTRSAVLKLPEFTLTRNSVLQNIDAAILSLLQ